jgi:hypothetical protein
MFSQNYNQNKFIQSMGLPMQSPFVNIPINQNSQVAFAFGNHSTQENLKSLASITNINIQESLNQHQYIIEQYAIISKQVAKYIKSLNSDESKYIHIHVAQESNYITRPMSSDFISIPKTYTSLTFIITTKNKNQLSESIHTDIVITLGNKLCEIKNSCENDDKLYIKGTIIKIIPVVFKEKSTHFINSEILVTIETPSC